MKVARYAQLAVPYLVKKLWEITDKPREEAIKAAKTFPGHVRDVMREKRDAEHQ